MPELFWGGAETQFRALLQGIDKERYSIKVLIEHSKREAAEDDYLFIQDHRDDIVFLEPQKKMAFLSLPQKIRCLKRTYVDLEVDRPDVILIYGGASFLLMPWLKAKGFCVCYSDRNGENASARQKIKNFFYRSADAIVCNSKPTFEARLHTHKKVRFIPNGTRVDHEFAPSGYESDSLLMISRVASVKNIECAIRSLIYLPPEFSIALIGKTEDESYEEEMKQLVKELGVEGRFHFVGYSKDIRTHLERSFCTLLPSHAEGMPNAVLESWAHERPAIVSDIPANASLVDDDAMRFPCDAPDLLAKRVMDLKQAGKGFYDDLCRSYKKIVEDRYSMGKMVERYEALFDFLSAERRQYEKRH